MKLIESRKRTTTCRLSSGIYWIFGFFASPSLSLSLSLSHVDGSMCCRHLKGEDITSLGPKELILLEEALDNGLSSIREKQVSIQIFIYIYVCVCVCVWLNEDLNWHPREDLTYSFLFFADGVLGFCYKKCTCRQNHSALLDWFLLLLMSNVIGIS